MSAKKISELKRTYSSSNDDLILLQKSYGTRIITKADFLAGYSPGTGNGGNSVSKKFTIEKDDWSFDNNLNKYKYILTHEMDLKIEELIVNFYDINHNIRILLDYAYIDLNNISIVSDTNISILAAITKTIREIDLGDGQASDIAELRRIIETLTVRVNTLTTELKEAKDIIDEHTTLV